MNHQTRQRKANRNEITLWCSFFCKLLLLICLSCGKKDTKVTYSKFEGISLLVENADGSYTLSWPVAPSKDPRYLVFRREESAEYNFESPYLSTLERSVTNETLLFQEVQCFVVRVSTEALIQDDNLNQLCTRKSSPEFNGISEIRVNEKGNLLLTWELLTVPGILYNVYMRREVVDEKAVQENYDKPFSVLADTTLEVGKIPRGNKNCFKVTVDASQSPIKVPPSISTKEKRELCTELLPTINYPGIRALDYAYCQFKDNFAEGTRTYRSLLKSKHCAIYEPSADSGLNGPDDNIRFSPGIILTWPAAEQADIVGYQINEGPLQDSEAGCVVRDNLDPVITARFPNCLVLSPEEDKMFRIAIEGVNPNRVYVFGVQAFDQFGELEENTVSIPIRAIEVGETN